MATSPPPESPLQVSGTRLKHRYSIQLPERERNIQRILPLSLDHLPLSAHLLTLKFPGSPDLDYFLIHLCPHFITFVRAFASTFTCLALTTRAQICSSPPNNFQSAQTHSGSLLATSIITMLISLTRRTSFNSSPNFFEDIQHTRRTHPRPQMSLY